MHTALAAAYHTFSARRDTARLSERAWTDAKLRDEQTTQRAHERARCLKAMERAASSPLPTQTPKSSHWRWCDGQRGRPAAVPHQQTHALWEDVVHTAEPLPHEAQIPVGISCSAHHSSAWTALCMCGAGPPLLPRHGPRRSAVGQAGAGAGVGAGPLGE